MKFYIHYFILDNIILFNIKYTSIFFYLNLKEKKILIKFHKFIYGNLKKFITWNNYLVIFIILSLLHTY